jgi:murein DD-endopeptidase MepM/ murein hydrolase activator NlpD
MSSSGKILKSPRLFMGISWGVTALVVVLLFGFALWRVFPRPVSAAPESTPTEEGVPTILPVTAGLGNDTQAIIRRVALKTDISQRLNYDVVTYTVQRGDALFSIAKQLNIKPETLLWANYDILQDNPDSLRVGQVLKIPPVDGVYYQLQEGDTLQSIADKFATSSDDILNWPGNNIDLTDPEVKPGTYVMVPGGHRAVVNWITAVYASGKSGTANLGGTACGAGPVGSTAFIWPTGNHYLSGNDYWSGHLGIDIAAGEGAPVWAADAGVVTMAQGGWNGGYGNVVMIDHGNGWLTVYGHLSQINVVPCQGVAAGTPIGLAGSTGNSTGAHLHFEVRLNGGFVNPWSVLPAP